MRGTGRLCVGIWVGIGKVDFEFCVYLRACVCACVCVRVYICESMRTHVRACVRARACVCVCVCARARTRACARGKKAHSLIHPSYQFFLSIDFTMNNKVWSFQILTHTRSCPQC